MKFFHLSDLHIGKQLHHYSMRQEQSDILKKIVDITKREHPDAVVIAGDIYDKSVPSAEAVTLFDDFLTGLTEITPRIPVLMISGNHDSAERLEYASSILKNHGVYICGMPPKTEEEHLKKVTLTDAYGAVDFYLMPFIKPSYVRNLFPGETIESYEQAVKRVLEREAIDDTRRNVMVSHQFYVNAGEKPKTSDSETIMVGGVDEVDIRNLLRFDYAALGHIHRPQKIKSSSYRYCGTPLKYSISEENQKKSITCVELKEKGEKPIITEIPLPALRELMTLRGTLEEVLSAATEGNKDDFISITLTDEIDPYHPKERLEEVYSHILEIRVDNERTRNILSDDAQGIEEKSPFEIFAQFFEEMQSRSMTDAEKKQMEEIFTQVMEGENAR